MAASSEDTAFRRGTDDSVLRTYCRETIDSMEFPWEVDRSSADYQYWLEDAAERMERIMAEAEITFLSHSIEPPPDAADEE